MNAKTTARKVLVTVMVMISKYHTTDYILIVKKKGYLYKFVLFWRSEFLFMFCLFSQSPLMLTLFAYFFYQLVCFTN